MGPRYRVCARSLLSGEGKGYQPGTDYGIEGNKEGVKTLFVT